MKFLLILNWTIWSALLVALIYAVALIFLQEHRTPEAGPVLSWFLVGTGVVFLVGTGGLLHWLAQKKSVTTLVILSWPLIPLVARPIVRAVKAWKCSPIKSVASDLPGA